MSKLKALQAATSLKELAPLLGVKAGMLSNQLYKKPKESLYKKFEIPKRHGGTREISAPEGDLKLLQHRVSRILQVCQAEINLTHGQVEDEEHQGIAHGFKRHHTIMTNGRAHVTRRYVFNVDVSDFFGSINFGRVRGFFIRDKNFKLHPDVATVLAQIACHENKLPQGSPCSPVISNLIGHSLDIPLVRLAAGTGTTYTRYADDLTFSTNKQNFPSRIAVQVGNHDWEPGYGLKRIIARSGFSVNDKKTRMQYRDSRQEVTGLTVNRKVNVPATYRYTVRAMVDHLFKTGEFEFIYKTEDKNGNVITNKSKGERRQLLGMLSYIDQVDRFNAKLREANDLPPNGSNGRIVLFRRFLYYDAFYAADEPVIVCEGKTDNVYLKCAIKSLASEFPKIVTPGTPPKLKVRFFKYAERRTSEITDLGGGVGGICKMLKNYHEDLGLWSKGPTPMHPVILLIDNDSGADKIYEAIAGITKTPKPLGMADFIHVTANLYVVPTPYGPKKAKTAIEDFFDSATLKKLLNDKTFSREKKFDETKHFGKAAFALNIVAKNAKTIDFKKFKPVIGRLIKAMDDYEIRRATEVKKAAP
jgi:RNA-directed DNA polymerase